MAQKNLTKTMMQSTKYNPVIL